MINSMPNGNPYSTYKQTAVETSTTEKLLIMLFNGGIKFLKLAEQALEEKNYFEAHNSLTRVQDILSELMVTLDMKKGGEIAVNLYELYSFYRNEVIEANMKKDRARLKPVLEFFELFRDTWVEAANQLRIGAK